MRLPVAPLLPALRRVQQASTATQRHDAAWAFYATATPLLTHRCDAVIRRYAPRHWQAPEDLARDTLLTFVEVPARAHSCRAATAEGVLSWLRGAAYQHMRGTPEARACRELKLHVVPLTDAMVDALPVPATARSPHATRAFREAYAHAVRALDPLDQRVWITRVEQEIPAVEVARDLGQTANALRRRVHRVAADLREQLAVFDPALRRMPQLSPARQPRERRAR